MKTTKKTVQVVVAADADQDDCLTAAAEQYIEEHPALKGWDLAPVWADEDREQVALTVPVWALLPDAE